MNRPPGGIGRLALTLFVGAVVFAVAQVGWWIYFLVRLAPDRRHVLMFASEGVFFLLIALAGFALIYRALAQQVRLRRQRATFLSAVTHELKSPLAALRLYLETLEAGRVGEEKRGAVLRNMADDVERLERLVSNLLRAGELDSGHIAPRLEPVDLGSLVARAVDDARERLLKPGDALAAAVADGVVVRGDAELLRSVVDNLIDNAVKYSPPPRRIDVQVERHNGSAVLEVRDRGAGVDPETAASLFEPFSRGEDEMTRRTKGTGLGLYLVRGIVTAHGGTCDVESEGAGRGTAVRCRLPAAGSAPASPPAPPPEASPPERPS